MTQYAQFKNETSVLPFSITAAGVVYNVATFEKAGVSIPKTWSELIAACDKFKAKGITPIYSTYKDPWTVQQGLFDYITGGLMDVNEFYKKLNAAGQKIGSGSDISFQQDFAPSVKKMIELTPYFNSDAASRGYPDGNAAFAHGQAAMYLQGPWAIGEVATVNPKLKVGCFPLPVTDNPNDLKVRVNLDLAIWIPRVLGGAKKTAALKLLSYLMQPSVVNAYNQANLAFSPLKNPPAVTAPQIAGLDQYVKAGKFYQGAGTYVPNVIPIGNYLQELMLTKNQNQFLKHLDSDFKRLAVRTSA